MQLQRAMAAEAEAARDARAKVRKRAGSPFHNGQDVFMGDCDSCVYILPMKLRI